MTNGFTASATGLGALLDQAVTWLVHSGIQEPDGGVARYRHTDRQCNAPVSTEITAYAVSALVFLHRQTGSTEALAAARRAGRFLLAAWDVQAQAMPFEVPAAGERLAYFFDTGIVARGLLALWRQTGEAIWLEGARRVGPSLMSDFHTHAQGEFQPILRLRGKTAVPQARRWSREPGCYQLKPALAAWELAETMGDAAAAAFYEEALAAALRSQNAFLPGDADAYGVMDRLHAYGYFLEGLLPVARRPEVRAALAGGIARMSHWRCEIAGRFERSDVPAQLLRVRLWAEALGAVPLDIRAAAEEAERVREFQDEDADPTRHGGFHFGWRDGAMLPFANPVSTAFCTQALTLWELRRDGQPLPAWHELV